MGVDALDIVFRLEKSFGIKIPRGRVFEDAPRQTFGFPVKFVGQAEPLGPPPQWDRHHSYDITAGELHDKLCELICEQGIVIPFSSWNRVKKCLCDSLGVPPKRIKRQSRLISDLGAGF